MEQLASRYAHPRNLIPDVARFVKYAYPRNLLSGESVPGVYLQISTTLKVNLPGDIGAEKGSLFWNIGGARAKVQSAKPLYIVENKLLS